LKKSPFARAAFERAAGGRITSFGRNDGKMTIQRYPRGFCPSPHLGLSPFAAPALGILPGMSQAIGAAANAIQGASPFSGLASAGLSNILGGGGNPFGALGGAGYGSWNPQAAPGNMSNTSRGAETAHTRQNAALLNDPSLTVEDAIMLMLMNIMNKMDKDIKAQGEKINKMQNQQNKKSQSGKAGGGLGGLLGTVGKVAGTAFGGPMGSKIGSSVGNKLGGAISGQGGANGAKGKKGEQPSVDVETQKLQRMMTKRNSMFQMLQKIMEGYAQTAKGTIQSMNR